LAREDVPVAGYVAVVVVIVRVRSCKPV